MPVLLQIFTNNYLGAVRYRYTTTNRNIILGIHAAINGGKFPLVENMVENRSVMMNKAAVTNPTAKWTPLPPLTFLPATMAPIKVNKITVTQVASRL